MKSDARNIKNASNSTVWTARWRIVWSCNPRLIAGSFQVVICNDCREFGSHQGHCIKHIHQISEEMKVQIQVDFILLEYQRGRFTFFFDMQDFAPKRSR